MGRKRIVLLAGVSFTGTYVASRILSSGKDVLAIVVETTGAASGETAPLGERLRRLWWYLRTGDFFELFNRILARVGASSYEGTHRLNRLREIFSARIAALCNETRARGDASIAKSGEYL